MQETTTTVLAADLDYDFNIRNVCSVLWRLLRSRRLTTPEVVGRMQRASPAYDEPRVALALGALSRCRLAWQDGDGYWYARGLNVLFCDEDAARRRQFAVESEGHAVSYAARPEDAASALESAGPEGFDVVYLDSDPTGDAAAEWLASQPRYLEVPVIIHSRDPEGSHATARTLQALGFLVGQFAFGWQWPPICSLLWLRESEPLECAELPRPKATDNVDEP